MTSTKSRQAPAGEHPALAVTALRKRFTRSQGEAVNAIDGVDLTVAKGEIVVLLGPSGCGKTTLLRTVAGLERPDSGTIDVEGRTVFSTGHGKPVIVPSEHRNLSMMFQSYALWPHMDVAANVAYPLRRRKVRKAEALRRAQESLTRTGIAGLGAEYPHQLSGGQQQRVALSRAIIAESPLILFDEPLSNVDAKVRTELRSELMHLQRKLGFAALYVTHDQSEAMEMGHRIAVMKGGRIDQLGTARDIYERPGSRYVANFVGAVNEIVGSVVAVDQDQIWVETSFGRVAIDRTTAEGSAIGTQVLLLCRPEWFVLDQAGNGRGWPATVERQLFLGAHTEVFVRVGSERIQVRASPEHDFREGSAVNVSLARGRCHALPLDSVTVA